MILITLLVLWLQVCSQQLQYGITDLEGPHTHTHTHTPVYVNHRPVFGLSPSQFTDAFRVLGQRSGASKEWTVDRSKLLQLLQEKGGRGIIT